MTEQIKKILSGVHFTPLDTCLRQWYGEQGSLEMRGNIERRLQRLLEDHQDDEDALREESWYYILPSIAIYLTLREHNDSALALERFREIYFDAAEKGAMMLRKRAEDPVFWKNFPHEMAENKEGIRGGFQFHRLQDDETGSEFHVLKCPYHDFCVYYQCVELTPIFCECDDIVYGSIHPCLRWDRTKTIGRGDALCNFKFTILEAERAAGGDAKNDLTV